MGVHFLSKFSFTRLAQNFIIWASNFVTLKIISTTLTTLQSIYARQLITA